MTSIGIDLGTTNSVTSHTSGGAPEVIPNREGGALTPSVVGFRRTAGGGDYLVGGEAVRYARSAPRDTVYSTKRLIGLNYDTPEVLDVRRKVGYEIVQGRGEPGDLAACVRIGGRALTPIEVATLVVGRLRDDSAAFLKRPVEGATITVPAHFQDCQTNATREAGEHAGLKLRPLLKEPVAAALAFTLRERAKGHRLLVYDLGGGTFDASIVEIAGGLDTRPDEKNIQVLRIDGDMWLGGDDFDHLVADRIFDWAAARYDFDARADPGFRTAVKPYAEAAKVELSGRDEVTVAEPNVYRHPEKGLVSLNLTLTRRDLEADIGPRAAHSMTIVERLLVAAGMPAEKLTAVVLAGGSTRVPLVRAALRARFGEKKVRHDLDPMHCVSLGAAIWNDRFPLTAAGVVVLDRMGQTGIPTAMPYGVEIYKNHNPRSFEVVVPAHTPYPTAQPFRKTFRPTTEDQRSLVIPVYEGTGEFTPSNRCQGVVAVNDLPAGIPKDAPVHVEFRINVHGTLTVEVEIPAIDFRTSTEIRRNQAARSGGADQPSAAWRDDVANVLARSKRCLEDYGEFVTPEQKKKIERLRAEAQAALADNDPMHGSQSVSAVFVALIETGTAGVLMQAAVATQLASGEVAVQIARTIDLLKEKARAGDAEAVREVCEVLSDEVTKVIGGITYKQVGPEPGQVTT